MSQGDSIYAEVGNELQINGTSGNPYYTILEDVTYGKFCEVEYNATGGEVHTELFADFFGERPQIGVGYYTLPKFTNFDFYDVELGSTSHQLGAYPNYNSDYGFGAYMRNENITTSIYTDDTSTSSMSENCCGSTEGYFTQTYDSSLGTY